ncbi:MAG: SHOCT domain-containing protein [Alphaproteobacteria bacterium]
MHKLALYAATTPDSFLWTIGVVLALYLVVLVIIRVGQFWLRRAMKTAMARQEGFVAGYVLLGRDGQAAIGIDPERRLVCLVRYKASRHEAKIVPYRDALAVEILQNGVMVTNTAGLGAAGGVLGGFLSKSTSRQRISRIDLKLTVNDLANPAITVNLFHTIPLLERGQNANGIVITQMMNKAHDWLARLDVAIKQGAAEGEGARIRNISTPPSIADEIAKLAGLREQGLITADEYAHQKSRLLGGIGTPERQEAPPVS